MRSSSTIKVSGPDVHPNVCLPNSSQCVPILLDTLSTLALVLTQCLGLMAALSGGVTGAACATVDLALGASLFGHGGCLVDAVDGGVL